MIPLFVAYAVKLESLTHVNHEASDIIVQVECGDVLLADVLGNDWARLNELVAVFGVDEHEKVELPGRVE